MNKLQLFISKIMLMATAIGQHIKELRQRVGELTNLTTTSKTSIVVALNEINAKFGGYLEQSDIIDNLTSTSVAQALSANQGKILKGLIDDINTLLSSDDTTLDELQEVVDFIKLNKTALDNLTINNIYGLQTALNNLQTNIDNLTKADVGLGNVQNYGIATKLEAETGTENAKYMTPLRVNEAIEEWVGDNNPLTAYTTALNS